MSSLIAEFFGKDFDKFFVGFDEHFARMQKLHDDVAKNIPNYPPYNIVKHNDNSYTIEIAVAGFGQQDIDIEIEDSKLTVRGKLQTAEDPLEDKFTYKGIANRAFTRTFGLEDEVVVKDAEIFNGMLKIALERLVPEAKQPKKIAVKSKGDKTLLTE